MNLEGKFDGGTDCQNIKQEMQTWIANGDRKFVINFSMVRWINSNGVGCLIGSKVALDKVDGRLILCSLNRRNLSTIYKMKLKEIFEVQDTLPQALESLNTHKANSGPAAHFTPEKP